MENQPQPISANPETIKDEPFPPENPPLPGQHRFTRKVRDWSRDKALAFHARILKRRRSNAQARLSRKRNRAA